MERNDWTAVLIALLVVVALAFVFVTSVTREPASYYSENRTCIALVGCNGQ